MAKDLDLGNATSYSYYVSEGGTKTPEEFGEMLVNIDTVASRAEESASDAEESATSANESKETAVGSMNVAIAKANEASASADIAVNKAGEASASATVATNKATEASASATTASAKATESSQNALTAVGAKNDAVSAKNDAVTAKTQAQSAKDDAVSAKLGAESARDQVQSSANQITQNASDISELKGDFATMESDGVVPSADQILTDKGVTDSVPYHYRKTGGDGADRLCDQIVGGTVCFNQLCNDASVIVQSGRKYLSKIGTAWAVGTSTGTAITGLTSGADMIIDLTAMFGSTIADYIYQLEQTTAGAGVTFFKSLFPNDYYPYDSGTLKSVEGLSEHKMTGFNQWDEEYVLNSTINPDTGAGMAGDKNIRSKNYIPVIPNTDYYIKSNTPVVIVGYDANMEYVGIIVYGNPNSVFTTKKNNVDKAIHYIRFGTYGNNYGTTYNHDICINLSDPARNGQYEPYKAHSYPLDSTEELRGILKLDSNNKLYFDGDVYEYTGKVTRNTILRAYQSGDESLANAITDGTNTVVYSANASTEQATPYQHLQQCDPNGTEEYASTGIIPIGHNSFYPENLRAKVEQLPWNFANLIAPTESAFVATRNYTTGALFIVDNVLYKATSNIANGGTITPNTNCTATTLAEIISALA